MTSESHSLVEGVLDGLVANTSSAPLHSTSSATASAKPSALVDSYAADLTAVGTVSRARRGRSVAKGQHGYVLRRCGRRERSRDQQREDLAVDVQQRLGALVGPMLKVPVPLTEHPEAYEQRERGV